MVEVELHNLLRAAAGKRSSVLQRHGIDVMHLGHLAREHRRLLSPIMHLSAADMRLYRGIVTQIEEEEPRLRAALADLFAGPPGSIRVTGCEALSSAQQAAVGEAVAWLATVTAMSATVHLVCPPGRSREAYDPATCSLLLSSAGTPAPVIVHELGHALEHQAASAGLIDLRHAFYSKRTLGEAVVSLATATGNPAYHPAERTKMDQWLDPYIGKVYPDVRASEVVSMGLQLLYADPVLLIDDLEHLDFLYVFLRGHHE